MIRVILRLLMLALVCLWGWLAVTGTALLVWQGRGETELSCHYITALSLVDLRYVYDPTGPLGRKICPLTLDVSEI